MSKRPLQRPVLQDDVQDMNIYIINTIIQLKFKEPDFYLRQFRHDTVSRWFSSIESGKFNRFIQTINDLADDYDYGVNVQQQSPSTIIVSIYGKGALAKIVFSDSVPNYMSINTINST